MTHPPNGVPPGGPRRFDPAGGIPNGPVDARAGIDECPGGQDLALLVAGTPFAPATWAYAVQRVPTGRI